MNEAIIASYTRLASAIRAAFPDRIGVIRYADPNGVTVEWIGGEPTIAEQASLDTVVNGWDWSPRVPRSLNDLALEISQLPTRERQLLADLRDAQFVHDHPDLIRRAGINLRLEDAL